MERIVAPARTCWQCAAFCGVWLWAEKHYPQLQSRPLRERAE